MGPERASMIETIRERRRQAPSASDVVVYDDEFEQLATEIGEMRDPRVFTPGRQPGAPIYVFGARVVGPDGSPRFMPF